MAAPLPRIEDHLGVPHLVWQSPVGGLAYTLTGLALLLEDPNRHVRMRGPGWEWDGLLLFLAVAAGACGAAILG